MTDRDLNVVLGALLHDIGKVIYRDGSDVRTHSESGYDFLKNELKIEDTEILNCVRFHHGRALSSAKISDDSLAYVVYIADNIASSVDRREKMEEEKGFELHTPLQPVFNLLNKNKGNSYYSPQHINVEKEINFYVQYVTGFKDSQLRYFIQTSSL
ncbi:MAG: HD domain-containing protein [Oribacterium sp.]|nr:HD domain-containing protein [Oribacterium sp.]